MIRISQKRKKRKVTLVYGSKQEQFQYLKQMDEALRSIRGAEENISKLGTRKLALKKDKAMLKRVEQKLREASSLGYYLIRRLEKTVDF